MLDIAKRAAAAPLSPSLAFTVNACLDFCCCLLLSLRTLATGCLLTWLVEIVWLKELHETADCMIAKPQPRLSRVAQLSEIEVTTPRSACNYICCCF